MGALFVTISALSFVGAIVDDGAENQQSMDRPSTETRTYGAIRATECQEVEPGIYFAIGQDPITLDPDIDELRLQWKATSSFSLALERSVLSLRKDSGYEEFLLHDQTYSPPLMMQAGISILLSTDILPYLVSIQYAGIPFTIVEELYNTANQLAVRFCSPSPMILNRGIGIDIGNTANQESSLGRNQPLSTANSQADNSQNTSSCKLLSLGTDPGNLPQSTTALLILAFLLSLISIRFRRAEK